jgi:hypothetical protein
MAIRISFENCREPHCTLNQKLMSFGIQKRLELFFGGGRKGWMICLLCRISDQTQRNFGLTILFNGFDYDNSIYEI